MHQTLIFFNIYTEEYGADLLCVELPGREARQNEAPMRSCQEVARSVFDVLAPVLQDGCPYIMIAHSVGTWMAYEFALVAAAASLPPSHAFMACFPGPFIPDAARPWTTSELLTDPELQAQCRLWGSTNAIFRPDLWAVFSPLFRADFPLFDKFVPSGSPMPCGVHATAATRDQMISPAMVGLWGGAADSSCGVNTTAIIEGGHLIVYDATARAAWFNLIVAHVRDMAIQGKKTPAPVSP